MEILDLRHLRSSDLEPLLEEEKSLWQRDLQWDYSSSAALIKRYVDASALPGYAAIEGGKTVGYSFYVYENYKGLIGDVFVSDSSCAGATEIQLLTHVFETLQATPGIRRIEAQLMNLRQTNSGDAFLGRKLQSFRRQFMVLPLEDAPAAPNSPSTHFRIEPWD